MKNRKSEIADIVTHQIEIQITNAQSQNRNETNAEKKILQKFVDFKTEDKKFREMREPEDIEKTDTDKSINVIAELKHVTD